MGFKGRTAIILGATGLTGNILLQYLLEDARYAKIKLFSRSSVGLDHAKLEEFLVDLFHFDSFQDEFRGDTVFCCIGTTAAKTPDKELYHKIDYGIPVAAAKIARRNGIPSFIVVSALGADSDSRIFYNRVKGTMEMAILKRQIPKVHILQPSLIGGNRKENRTGERVFKQIMKVVDPILIGGLEKYRSIRLEQIVQAMIWLDNHTYEKERIPSDELQKLAGP
ncbi:NAD(P)H-binding protein [Maribacter sp. 2304DJ31-5]|uniref:NAD(P)H-binding protein n=1 Tax=Maribacter sp. 2304DJ31-5 TaxID=3386273 RepID=UPI0039BD7BA5